MFAFAVGLSVVTARLLLVIALATLNERFVAAFAEPIKANVPAFKPWTWTLYYMGFVTGFLVGWFSGLNLFADLEGLSFTPVAGQVLTSLLVGGGSTLLHDYFQPLRLTVQQRLQAMADPSGMTWAGGPPKGK